MAVNVWQGVQQGQQLVDGLFQQQDQMRAGRALAGGNYAQAMQALGAGGNIQGVRQLQGDQIAMQDRQAAATKEQQAQQLATTLQVVRTLKRARSENQDLGALVEQYRPAFAAMGTDPAQFDAIAQQIAANPALLDQIENVIGEQARKLEIVNFGSGRGASVVDTITGQEVRRLNPDQQPITVANNSVLYDPVRGEALVDTRSPEYIQRDPTRELIEVTPRAASAGGGQPRGIRNNNPGNIEDGPFARSLPGYKGSDGRFAVFETPQDGVNAGAQLLGSYARRGVVTPAQVINRWAPPSDNNPTQAYAQYVAQRLGIGVDDPIPESRRAEAFQAINEFENGTRGPSQGSGGARVVSAAQAPQETAAQQAASAARNFTQERQLRTDIGNNPAAKELALVRPHIQTIGRIAGQVRDGRNVSAQDDLALIFAFMKVLDPTSVVREGEFANAQNTGGIAENVVNAYNKALNGERLTDRQRSEFFRTANGMMRDRQANYQEVVNRQRDLAAQYGLSPDRVAPAQPGGGQQGPRVRFELSPQQQAWVSQNGRAESGGSARRAGSRENPRLINPSSATQSYNNIPSGSYFLTPDGQLRQKR
jgi:hypothetical protein